jgi:hypothetical protein
MCKIVTIVFIFGFSDGQISFVPRTALPPGRAAKVSRSPPNHRLR